MNQKEYKKQWKKENPEKVREYNRRWRKNNPEKVREGKKRWRQENKKEIRIYEKKRREKNKKYYEEYRKEYYKKNKDKFREYYKKLKKSPIKYQCYLEYIRRCNKKKWRTDKLYRLRINMRRQMSHALHGEKRGNKWESLLGYNVKQLKEHLEKQFTLEMNWDNYGTYWHIDHIIPKVYYRFESPYDIGFKMCWSLANLQPLEAKKNWSKNCRINT
jgi:hypothetical protein